MDFKEFIKVNRLRGALSQDNFPMAISKKYKKNKYADQMYEGFRDYFGIFIQRPSIRTKNNLVRKLEVLGCLVYQDGDYEACLKVPFDKALEVAKFLKLQKDKPKNPKGNIKALLKSRQAVSRGI